LGRYYINVSLNFTVEKIHFIANFTLFNFNIENNGHKNISKEELEKIRINKKNEKRGFKKRIILDNIN
jgi:hypothetical protein|tara:strand:- start:261 stop:464 length:204 start_codon:yes stop_codon:yes gene_type:complete